MKRKILKTSLFTLLALLTITNLSIASSIKKNIQAVQDQSINISLNDEKFIAKEDDGTILAPIIYEGRTYLPIRNLAEAAGLSVGWNNDTRTVLLNRTDKLDESKYQALNDENKSLKDRIDELEEEIDELEEENEDLSDQLKELGQDEANNDESDVRQVVLYWANGNIRYEGEALDEGYTGYHGYGKLYFSDTEAQLNYEGNWKNGKYDGYGKEYEIDGFLRYEGNWKNGERYGYGRSYKKGKYGYSYEGYWSNYQLNGYGKKYDPDGQLIYVGEWKDGKFHGFGITYDKNGTLSYIGQFEEYSYRGWGLHFDANGNFEYEAIIGEDGTYEILSRNINDVTVPAQVPVEVISGLGEAEIKYETNYYNNNSGGWYIDGSGNQIYKEGN